MKSKKRKSKIKKGSQFCRQKQKEERRRTKKREFMCTGKNAKMQKSTPEEYRKGQGSHPRCAGNSTETRWDCGGERVRTR